MEHLNAAALDVTLLVTTVRALRASDSDDEAHAARKLRKRWVGELKRAVAAYLAALWRSDDAAFDAAALSRCRVAAESEMPHALDDQARIQAVLDEQAQALTGYASARHDLWRLAHVILHLRTVRRLLEQRGFEPLASSRSSPGRYLQRRLRRAMSDYARALMREAGPGSTIVVARQAAVQRLDERCIASAEALVDAVVEEWQRGIADLEEVCRLIDEGVMRPLRALAEDWRSRPLPRPHEPSAAIDERLGAEVGA